MKKKKPRLLSPKYFFIALKGESRFKEHRQNLNIKKLIRRISFSIDSFSLRDYSNKSDVATKMMKVFCFKLHSFALYWGCIGAIFNGLLSLLGIIVLFNSRDVRLESFGDSFEDKDSGE